MVLGERRWRREAKSQKLGLGTLLRGITGGDSASGQIWTAVRASAECYGLMCTRHTVFEVDLMKRRTYR